MKLRSYSLAAAAVALIANAAFADVTPATTAPVKAPVGATAAVETKMEMKKQETAASAQKASTDVKQAASTEKAAVHKHTQGVKKTATKTANDVKKNATVAKVSEAPKAEVAKTSK